MSIHSLYDRAEISHVCQDNSVASMQSHFVSPKIMKYIKKCDKYMKIGFKDHQITFHFHGYRDFPVTISKIMLSVRQAIAVKCACNIDKQIDIYIIFAPYKRFYDLKKNIGPDHINGGFTIVNDGKIFVFRSEEYAKVMIHEIVHHCKAIHSDIFHGHDIIALKQAFNISEKTVLIPNEAVVELWAAIFYCHLLSYEYYVPVHKLLEIELNFGITQSHKMIKKQNGKKWEETSNAFCYVIFKTILLGNLKKFLKDVTYPYNSGYVTRFLIDNKDSIVNVTNVMKVTNVTNVTKVTREIEKINYKKFFDSLTGSHSLRMMILSDF